MKVFAPFVRIGLFNKNNSYKEEEHTYSNSFGLKERSPSTVSRITEEDNEFFHSRENLHVESRNIPDFTTTKSLRKSASQIFPFRKSTSQPFNIRKSASQLFSSRNAQKSEPNNGNEKVFFSKKGRIPENKIHNKQSLVGLTRDKTSVESLRGNDDNQSKKKNLNDRINVKWHKFSLKNLQKPLKSQLANKMIFQENLEQSSNSNHLIIPSSHAAGKKNRLQRTTFVRNNLQSKNLRRSASQPIITTAIPLSRHTSLIEICLKASSKPETIEKVNQLPALLKPPINTLQPVEQNDYPSKISPSSSMNNSITSLLSLLNSSSLTTRVSSWSIDESLGGQNESDTAKSSASWLSAPSQSSFNTSMAQEEYLEAILNQKLERLFATSTIPGSSTPSPKPIPAYAISFVPPSSPNNRASQSSLPSSSLNANKKSLINQISTSTETISQRLIDKKANKGMTNSENKIDIKRKVIKSEDNSVYRDEIDIKRKVIKSEDNSVYRDEDERRPKILLPFNRSQTVISSSTGRRFEITYKYPPVEVSQQTL